MTSKDTLGREAALTSAAREALELLARGAATDAAHVLEGALEGEDRARGPTPLTVAAVAALQAMTAEMPAPGRTAADVQALLGALMFAAHLGVDAEALAAVVTPEELAVTLARVMRGRR